MQSSESASEKLFYSIVFFIKNTKKLGVTKLMKLLYYLDFFHYKQTGRSVTGLTYTAWPLGPVPKQVWEELHKKTDSGLGLFDRIRLIQKENDFLQVQASGKLKFDEDVFTDRELDLLKKVSEIFRDANAEQMVESSHMRNAPWDRTCKTTGYDVPIDYELVFDGTEDYETMEVVRERQAEREEMKKLFMQQ